MVLDSSALLAILLDEPDRRRFTEAIEADPRRLVSAATLLESAIVIEARRGESAGQAAAHSEQPTHFSRPVSSKRCSRWRPRKRG